MRAKNSSASRNVRRLFLESLESRRVLAPGDLDLTFDGDGKVLTAVGSYYNEAWDVAVQQDGKIVAAGFSASSTFEHTLVRYNEDGSLDTSFGGDGKVTTAFPGSHQNRAYGVAVQPDGKIILAGHAYSDIAIQRYNPNGSLDGSFGIGGMVRTAVGTAHDEATVVAVQADGKVVIAGYSSNGTNNDILLVRYHSDGTLDDTFGDGGKVTTSFGSSGAGALKLAFQQNGKIVVVGAVAPSNATPNDVVVSLIRYNVDGTLDTSFDGDGKVVAPLIISAGNGTGEAGLALQADGKILVSGKVFNGNIYDSAILRYSADGNLDASFGLAGQALAPTGSNDSESADLVIQPNGKIISAGMTWYASNPHFTLSRLTTDGSLDASFGIDGTTIASFGSSYDNLKSVALQPDGKILALGFSGSGSAVASDFALARFEGDDDGALHISDILDVSPDPRSTPVDSIDVLFSEAIDPNTFTRADVRLTRNGGPNLIGPSVSISLVSGRRYRISGLGSLTSPQGNYLFRVDATGIDDAQGNPGSGIGTEGWVVDLTPPRLIGYYDMSLGQGNPTQEAAILASGNTPVQLFDLTAAELASVQVIDVQNPDNEAYGAEYVSRLANIQDAVDGGAALVIHDRYVDPAETILPGGAGFNIVRSFSDSRNIDVQDNTTLVTNGPGGIVNNTTLDGGTESSHGFAFSGSLPAPAKQILSTGDATHIVTFAYRYGGGTVIYSSIPLDHYRNSPTLRPNFNNIYAPNVLAYAATNALGFGSFREVAPDPRNAPVASVQIVFTDPIDPATFDFQDLALNRDGTRVPLDNSVSVSNVTGNRYEIQG